MQDMKSVIVITHPSDDGGPYCVDVERDELAPYCELLEWSGVGVLAKVERGEVTTAERFDYIQPILGECRTEQGSVVRYNGERADIAKLSLSALRLFQGLLADAEEDTAHGVLEGGWDRVLREVDDELKRRAMDPGAIGDYQRRRLREVTRATVRKERNTLSVFLAWCREQGLIDRIEMPELPRGATGSRATTRKAHAIDVTPEQVEAFLAALPEMSAGKIRGSKRFHVRARFIVAWETGLRPSTLDRLRTPEHYVVGTRTLRIEDAIDKARFGREVPITERCARTLDAVIGVRTGLIFGRHDARDYVAAAAKAAGLPTGFSPYDLRHGRALALTEASGNLPGVAFLLGHRKLTTTDRYLRGTRRAADAALAALSSGAIPGPEPQNANGAPVAESAESLESTESVRRAGLEPARCYPLAPQGTEHHGNSRSSESDPPHGTANKPQGARDSGARPQNPESAEVATLCGLAKAGAALSVLWDALELEVGS